MLFMQRGIVQLSSIGVFANAAAYFMYIYTMTGTVPGDIPHQMLTSVYVGMSYL